MSLLYEALPEAVAVKGKDYPIYTDFRDWLRFFDLQEEEKIPDREKLLLLLEWFRGEKPPLEQLPEAVSALIGFATRQNPEENPTEKPAPERKSSEKILSWSYDAGFVYAAFLSVYHLDLRQVESLHWHIFLALFDGLPEDTPIKQRMQYRSVNLSAVKDKQERKRIRKIQEQIRIPHKALDALQCGGFFG